MTPELLEARRKLLEDFPTYAKYALKIRTKAGEIAPLLLNEAQRRLHAEAERMMSEEGRVRLVVLKGRQMGQSTLIGGRLYWRVSQREAKKALVVTHHADSTRALFDMTKRYHDLLPDFLRPSTRYSSRKELQFDTLQSGYVIATAGGDSIGRGETFTYAHLSELAFWPRSSAQSNFNGLLQAIPDAEGTEAYIESTANGISGLFYDTCQAAIRGESAWRFLFLPWTIQAEYRAPVPPHFERTPEEKELVARHGLDDGQLMFRRRKIAENGPDLFQQEYPLTADEAFLTTGRPVFHPHRLADMWQKVRDPITRRALEGSEWEHHPRGELSVYVDHKPSETYTIGADVGAGVRRDWSVAQVLDSRKRQVAVWRGQSEPDAFGYILYQLARHYNDAQVCCESNNHGILTLHVLTKTLEYPHVYQETIYDQVMDKETVRVGFLTTEKSKGMVINKLRAVVRDSEVEVYDRTTLEEMRGFVVTEAGRMEGERGTFDDCVMALAFSNHINDGHFEPIINRDEWYFSPEE